MLMADISFFDAVLMAVLVANCSVLRIAIVLMALMADNDALMAF
jgi:hypothetical protein